MLFIAGSPTLSHFDTFVLQMYIMFYLYHNLYILKRRKLSCIYVLLKIITM